MKPAFPQWLRRIDPLLAREDENLLFQFFRERRARSGGGWGWRVWAFVAAPVVLMLAMYAARGAPDLLLPISFAWIAYGAVLLYIGLARSRGEGRTTFPRSMLGFFPWTAISPATVEDLWLAGLDGRIIAETGCLEWAEFWRRFAYGLALCPPLAALLLFRTAVPELLAAALLLATAISLYVLLSVGVAATWAVDNFIDLWLKHVNYRRFILKNLRQAVLMLGFVVGIVFLLMFAIVTPAWRFVAVEPFTRPDELAGLSRDLAVRLAIAAVALLAGFYPACRLVWSVREGLMAQAGSLFEELVRRRLQNDDDATAPPQAPSDASAPE